MSQTQAEPPPTWSNRLLYCATPDPEQARRGRGFNLLLLSTIVIIGSTSPLFAALSGNAGQTLLVQWSLIGLMVGLYAATRRGFVIPAVAALLVGGTVAIVVAPTASATNFSVVLITPTFLTVVIIIAGMLLPARGMALTVAVEVAIAAWYYSGGGSPLLVEYRHSHPLEALVLSTMVPVLFMLVGVLAWFANRLIREATHDLRRQNAALARANLELGERERFRRELEIARSIQQRMLPAQLPQLPHIEIAAVCLPALETSGDSYDVLVSTAGAVHLIVSDACGKSVPAALLIALSRNTLRAALAHTDDPAAALTETNRVLAPDLLRHQFVAVSCVTLVPQSGVMHIANAGQMYPALVSPAGTGRSARCTFVETSGSRLPLGIVPAVVYTPQEWPVQAGDLLVCCTDGVIEATNPQGDLFSFERLAALLETLADPTHSAAAVLTQITTALTAWIGTGSAQDDITLLVVRLR